MENMDYYINMVDGKKGTKADAMKFLMNGIGNYNVNNGNSVTNRTDAARSYRSAKNAPTYEQKKKLEVYNAELKKLGLKTFSISKFDSRKAMGKLLETLRVQLEEQGIKIEAERTFVKCADCKHYRQTLGNSGVCSRMRTNRRSNHSCAGGEKKNETN